MPSCDSALQPRGRRHLGQERRVEGARVGDLDLVRPSADGRGDGVVGDGPHHDLVEARAAPPPPGVAAQDDLGARAATTPPPTGPPDTSTSGSKWSKPWFQPTCSATWAGSRSSNSDAQSANGRAEDDRDGPPVARAR